MASSSAVNSETISKRSRSSEPSQRFAGGSYQGPSRVDGPADLYQAAVSGDLGRISLILSENVHPDEWGPSGCLPLIAAAEQGQMDAVKLLLTGNADVNKTVRAAAVKQGLTVYVRVCANCDNRIM